MSKRAKKTGKPRKAKPKYMPPPKPSGEDVVEMWTDGSCYPNPGRGGWGVVAVRNGVRREWDGACAHTTNNRMEMTAAIEGLKRLREGSRVVIYSDSDYLVKGMMAWRFKWERNGWKRQIGEAWETIPNADLWEQLVEGIRRHQEVYWEWVKGHAGNPGNELANEIAEFARENAKFDLTECVS